jgi:replication-associated recombination protein RarA
MKFVPFDTTTVSGNDCYEVVSSLQKAIRRGELDDALYWATDMHLSGLTDWLWKRIAIICSEDVGPAWPEGPAVIGALFEAHSRWKHSKNSPSMLFAAHAIVLLCRAPKTRLVDHALTVHLADHEGLRREIPDHSRDMHTAKGKAMGRGLDHFLDVAARVHPKVDDPDIGWYAEKQRELWLDGKTASSPTKRTRADQTALELGEDR